MSQGRRPRTWPIAVLAAFSGGCVANEHVPEGTAVPPVKAACDTEARQLMETTAVYPAPKSGLAPVANLEQGRYVYRCEQRGEWLGVMFPAEGEKVDCAERRPERACALGWIRKNTKMQLFG